MAETTHTAGDVGEPYRPSNGVEGDDFQARFCVKCACDENTEDPFTSEGKTCPILDATYALGIDHPDYPPQWTHDAEGEPTCTAFVEDVGQGWIDPHQVAKDKARYDGLRRDPVTGRPVIA